MKILTILALALALAATLACNCTVRVYVRTTQPMRVDTVIVHDQTPDSHPGWTEDTLPGFYFPPFPPDTMLNRDWKPELRCEPGIILLNGGTK